MIDAKTGFEATVRPYKSRKRYTEYRAPRESPLYNDDASDCYITAVTDERFVVDLNIPTSFDFKKYTHLELECCIDGGQENGGAEATTYYSKSSFRGKKIHCCFDSVVIQQGGEWQDVGFSFKALSIAEDCELNQEEEDRLVVDRGKIEVAVRLGNYKDIPGRQPYSERAQQSQETSKRVAVDKAKSHGLQLVPVGEHEMEQNVTPADRADAYLANYEFKPARGKAGEITWFTFYYVSRMVLELKKIIPVDMSVPAQASLLPSASDTMLASSAPTQQAVEAASTRKNAVSTDKDAPAPAIVAGSDVKPTIVKSEPGTGPTIKMEQPAQAKIKVEPKSIVNVDVAASTPAPPTRTATPTTPRAKPNSAVICLDDDDDKIEVVSARETRRTNVKREPENTIDITSDEPAAKKIKRDPGNNIHVPTDESAAKKTKLEVGGVVGGRAASVASTSTFGSVGSGGQDAKAKRKARVMLELQEIALKKELMELED
ncbi:hypothetical protein LTR56_024054 [Elasticomyces elasticus]|nr:hypothetical protein LTR56_024054 [Elasticomyces elasticus]KAK3666618.1 hypothetical protein LTR22_002562 [Elasticomyces elasticus]KAK4928248.1 hypothetical protein LTR49_004925 [Elasticomyces elasticus]KAK5758632.1 hypothetical protein LTS12_011336 [Elasticomyces elasticus]